MAETYLPEWLESVARLREKAAESQRTLARAISGLVVLPTALWELVADYACEGLFETRLASASTRGHFLVTRDNHWWMAKSETNQIQVESTHFVGPVFVLDGLVDHIVEAVDGSLLLLVTVVMKGLACFSVSCSGQVAELWQHNWGDMGKESPPRKQLLVGDQLARGPGTCRSVGFSWGGNYFLLDAGSGTRLSQWSADPKRWGEASVLNGDLLVETCPGQRRVVVLSLTKGHIVAQWPYPVGARVHLFGFVPSAMTARFVASRDDDRVAVTTCDLLTGRVLHQTTCDWDARPFDTKIWSSFSHDNWTYARLVGEEEGPHHLYLLL